MIETRPKRPSSLPERQVRKTNRESLRQTPLFFSTEMMQRAGKEVSIGEGSAAAPKFNAVGPEVFRTRKREILDPMQQYVFEQFGYGEMARALRVPPVNLHSGELVEVAVPGGFVFDKTRLHQSLA
jgi:hypothetical protein